MRPPLTHRPSPFVAPALVCAATVLLVFALPFAVPVAWQPTVSASFVAGFSNRAAVLGAAALSAAVFLWSWHLPFTPTPPGLQQQPQRDPVDDRQLSPSLVIVGLLAAALFHLAAGWLVAHSHLRYTADAGYFIEQLSAHADDGRSLYTSLEFAYGPLLFYPTVLLHSLLRSSWLTAYFVSLALDSSLGLLLLAYILNSLPIRRSDRTFGFVLLSLGSITPLLGLNYTFLRFLSPFAALIFATGFNSAQLPKPNSRPSSGPLLRSIALLTVCELLLLAISPEIGIAFLFGAVAFAMLRIIEPDLSGSGAASSQTAAAPLGVSRRQPLHRRLPWLLAAIVPALCGILALGTAGRSYLRMLSSFSHGALNLPVAPYPHLLVFLFAVVWLVPHALGRALRQTKSRAPYSLRTVPCYAIGIALLPAALGRCDPLHVFFNGAGLLLLSLVAIHSALRRTRVAWLVAFVVFIAWEQAINNSLYADRTTDTLRVALMARLPAGLRRPLLAALAPINPSLASQLIPSPADADYQLDLPALERWVGNAPVATPLEVSPLVESALKASHHYRTGFYAFFVDVMNPTAEATKIRELNQYTWALLPFDPDDPFLETPRNIDGVQGFAFPYPLRHAIPYPLGQAFDSNIDDNWKEKARFGPYVLYRHE